jgi:tetratricopeptide (TPR) repeat protein
MLGLRSAEAGQDSVATTIRDHINGIAQSPAVGPFRPFLLASSHAIEAERFEAMGDTAGAIAASRMAVELIGEDVLGVERGRYRATYASLLMESGEPVAARDVYASLIERYPRVAVFELGLARAADAAGESERAAEHYRAVLDIWAEADDDLPALREAQDFVEAH